MPNAVPFRKFTADEHETWDLIVNAQAEARDAMIHPLFRKGAEALGLIGTRGVPDLEAVNRRLEPLTGFRGVAVEGLEDDPSFYRKLGERRFPIGNFIRARGDLSYTPAPDVIHDLYGHLPLLADRRYADFCAELGRHAARHSERPEVLKEFARLFWFTIEFGLISLPEGRRIFGAGIASSVGECRFALSDEPEVVPFDIEAIRNQEFKIDSFQRRLFLLRDEEQLYSCLPAFAQRY